MSNNLRNTLIFLCFSSLLFGCAIGLPDVGGEGEPCSKINTCQLGLTCVDGVCESEGGNDSQDDGGDEDTTTEEDQVVTTDFCDPDPCDASLHFRCDERADECVCELGYIDDGEGGCQHICEADTTCAEQNRECLVHDGTDGVAGTTYCNDCLAGYHADMDECVEDTICLATTCSSHGSCDDSTGSVVCTCDQGYAGNHCENCNTGFVWDITGESCVPSAN